MNRQFHLEKWKTEKLLGPEAVKAELLIYGEDESYERLLNFITKC